ELALDRIGLLEVCVRCIQNERLASAQLMSKQLLEARVPPFCEPGRDIHTILLGWIVVNVEVIGFQDSKIEFLVLNFVLAEILRSGWNGKQRCEKGREENGSRAQCHGCLGGHSSRRGLQSTYLSGQSTAMRTTGCRCDPDEPRSNWRS